MSVGNKEAEAPRRAEVVHQRHLVELTEAFAREGRELAGWPAAFNTVALAPAVAFVSHDPDIGFRLHVCIAGEGEREIEITLNGDGPSIVTLLEFGGEDVGGATLEMNGERSCRKWAAGAFGGAVNSDGDFELALQLEDGKPRSPRPPIWHAGLSEGGTREG
jgi:hypothetical protein